VHFLFGRRCVSALTEMIARCRFCKTK
jgi:hypothetical protein